LTGSGRHAAGSAIRQGVLDLDRTTMYTTFVSARPRRLRGGRISISVPGEQIELAHEALAGRPEADVFER
jgi:hypothetical protein